MSIETEKSIVKNKVISEDYINLIDKNRATYSAKYFYNAKILNIFLYKGELLPTTLIIIENVSDEAEAEKLFKSITLL